MKKICILTILFAMTISLFGCTKNPPDSPDTINTSSIQDMPSSETVSETPKTTFPESYMITTENRIDYQPGLECSAFSSAYILRHYGEEADGLKLYENFPGRLPEGGAMPSGIATYFSDNGYKASFNSDGTVDQLKELVSQGAPVIVFIHVEEPYETTHNTHYIPIVGYDTDNFYFAESLEDYANCKDEKDTSYNRKTDIAKFERLWDNIDGMWNNPYFLIDKMED